MNRRELEAALQDLFDGQLRGEAFEELQQRLRDDPEARGIYREYLLLEHCLKFRGKGVDMLRVVPMDRVNQRRQQRAMKIAGLAAAAVLVLATVVMALVMIRTPEPTLAFETSPGTELLISHPLTGESPPEGQVMEPGSRLELQRGTVELSFASGVRGIVRAPASLVLRRDDLLDLDRGTAWFEVPSQAAGFQVVTPDLVLTDLGTEFGIVSKPDFSDEVHVFSGKVEIFNRHGLKRKELVPAKHARSAGPAGRWLEIPVKRELFLDTLPENGRVAVVLDDSAVFTSSPRNEMVRRTSYTFSANEELSGFEVGASNKLVVTLSHERGEPVSVTYGGVAMVRTATGSSESKGIRKTSIYYLDSPPAAGGDLVIRLNETSNGVGGSLLALSNTELGGPVATNSEKGNAVSLSTPVPGCFLIATHACNDHLAAAVATARAPLEPVFGGPTGSSVGASGFLNLSKAGKTEVAFSGSKNDPVTAAAAFAPIP